MKISNFAKYILLIVIVSCQSKPSVEPRSMTLTQAQLQMLVESYRNQDHMFVEVSSDSVKFQLKGEIQKISHKQFLSILRSGNFSGYVFFAQYPSSLDQAMGGELDLKQGADGQLIITVDMYYLDTEFSLKFREILKQIGAQKLYAWEATLLENIVVKELELNKY